MNEQAAKKQMTTAKKTPKNNNKAEQKLDNLLAKPKTQGKQMNKVKEKKNVAKMSCMH